MPTTRHAAPVVLEDDESFSGALESGAATETSQADVPAQTLRDALPSTALGWVQVGVIVALLVVLYASVLPSVVSDWYNDEGYSHGFLVFPLALYIAWSHRGKLLAEPSRTELRGLLIVAAGCAMYVVGQLGAEMFTMRSSVILVLAGLSVTFWGLNRALHLAFPYLLLLSAIPLPVILYNKLAAPLQLLASTVATNVLHMASIPVFQDGNVIHLAESSLGVAEACSGLRSISSLAVMGLLLGYFQDKGLFRSLLLVALSVPIAIFVNVFRVTGTAFLVEYGDVSLAMGFYHSFAGWLVFLLGFLLLSAAAKLLDLALPGRKATA